MLTRPLARIAILLVAVAALTLSCGLDYALDFELTSVIPGANSVQVDYSLYNAGSRNMDNATIHIQVEATLATGGSEVLDQWTPGVNLDVFGTSSDTLIFYFSGTTNVDATAVVIGAGWDEHTSTN